MIVGLLVAAGALGTANPVFSQGMLHSVAGNEVQASVKQFPDLGNESVNPKAIKDFKKKFGDVHDEKWFRNKTRYISQFRSEDTRFKVEYDSRGNWSGTQKAYPGEKLADEETTMVKSVFYDYEIVWVTEFTLPEFLNPVYIIRLENKKNIKNICMNEGEIKILEEYTKRQ
jgi:hypothetical protein